MRILHHDYAGHAFPIELSRELARRGHEVFHAFAGGLLTPRGSLELRPEDPPRLHMVEVPMSPGYRKHKYHFLRRRAMELAYGVELEAVLQRVAPDLVISGNTPSEPQWRLARATRRQGVAFVSWIQDIYCVAVSRLARQKWPLIGNAVGWWYRQIDGRCLRASDAIVTITDDFVPTVRALGSRCPIAVIPNWAPLDELPLRPRRNAWAASHGLHDKFVFLYAGTLALKHDPELLYRVAERFQGDPDVRVVVVSEGPGADYLQRRKEKERLDGLLLLPFQPFAALPDVLATADVLVALLDDEAGAFSVPSKILTYHCAGRAILASLPPTNLAARLLRENRTGCCVHPTQPAGFLEAAYLLRDDSETRRRFGGRARAFAEREFDIAANADRFERVFNQAVEARRRLSRFVPAPAAPAASAVERVV